MKGAYEGDVTGPSCGVARELHRAFDRLSARVGEEDARGDAGQYLVLEASGELDLRLVVEVGAGHVHDLAGLLLDRGHHPRMRVAGRVDGDAGREVEELVAVDVGRPAALAVVHHEWVSAREA